MTIDVNVEKEGLRVTALIITNNVETHSAVSDIPSDRVEIIKTELREALLTLIYEAVAFRKVP